MHCPGQGNMPRHGTQLQLDASRLFDRVGKQGIQEFMQRSLSSIFSTKDCAARGRYDCLATYKQDVVALKDMLSSVEPCFHHSGGGGRLIFRKYKFSKHCADNSTPANEDQMLARSDNNVFFLGDTYSLGPQGRRFVYQCELQETLSVYQRKLDDYNRYAKHMYDISRPPLTRKPAFRIPAKMAHLLFKT